MMDNNSFSHVQNNGLTKEFLKDMTENFNFSDFYKKGKKALIVITQYDVIIVKSNLGMGEYPYHRIMQRDVLSYMEKCNRKKNTILIYRCECSDEISEIIFTFKDCGDRTIITEDMMEIMELIDRIMSMIDQNDEIIRMTLEEIKETYKEIKVTDEEIKETYNIQSSKSSDSLEKIELIGVPIKKYIKILQKQIGELENPQECDMTNVDLSKGEDR